MTARRARNRYDHWWYERLRKAKGSEEAFNLVKYISLIVRKFFFLEMLVLKNLEDG
jgi:hypothetical protein